MKIFEQSLDTIQYIGAHGEAARDPRAEPSHQKPNASKKDCGD
jgi:hypothetical protein